MSNLYVGTAGWSLRKELAEHFPSSGTHLQRYAARFNAVEINSSFYRPHRTSTYQRWADSVGESFRFAVKTPKQITHLQRLGDASAVVQRFVSEISGLGEKLGVVLVQLPPSLAYQSSIAEPFFEDLRSQLDAAIVCEPRHRSWFAPEVEAFFLKTNIGRVAADPSLVPAAAVPAGSLRVTYYRWHGSPRIYYSAYDDAVIDTLAACLRDAPGEAWCIFDNTAEGEAYRNALQLSERLGLADVPSSRLRQGTMR